MYEDEIVGQPIQGMPDCYGMGRGDRGYQLGARVRPQQGGPVFVKQMVRNRACWVHVQGDVGPLDSLFGGGGGFGDILTDGFRYSKGIFG